MAAPLPNSWTPEGRIGGAELALPVGPAASGMTGDMIYVDRGLHHVP
jgi:enoyl-[acyl-carrier-protein] reductase (NADH)